MPFSSAAIVALRRQPPNRILRASCTRYKYSPRARHDRPSLLGTDCNYTCCIVLSIYSCLYYHQQTPVYYYKVNPDTMHNYCQSGMKDNNVRPDWYLISILMANSMRTWMKYSLVHYETEIKFLNINNVIFSQSYPSHYRFFLWLSISRNSLNYKIHIITIVQSNKLCLEWCTWAMLFHFMKEGISH